MGYILENKTFKSLIASMKFLPAYLRRELGHELILLTSPEQLDTLLAEGDTPLLVALREPSALATFSKGEHCRSTLAGVLAFRPCCHSCICVGARDVTPESLIQTQWWAVRLFFRWYSLICWEMERRIHGHPCNVSSMLAMGLSCAYSYPLHSADSGPGGYCTQWLSNRSSIRLSL